MKSRSRPVRASICVVTIAAACTAAPEEEPEPVAPAPARAAVSVRAMSPLFRGDAIRRDVNGQCWRFDYVEPPPGVRRNPPAPYRLAACPQELSEGIGAFRRDTLSGACTLLRAEICPPGDECEAVPSEVVPCPPGSPDAVRREEDDDDEAEEGRRRTPP